MEKSKVDMYIGLNAENFNPHDLMIVKEKLEQMEDDKFFLEGGGQDELKDNSGLKFRDNIKNMWLSEMSDENKEIIWKYFKIFVILSEKYIMETLNKDK